MNKETIARRDFFYFYHHFRNNQKYIICKLSENYVEMLFTDLCYIVVSTFNYDQIFE